MSAEWSYAQLSKKARSVGGPEKLIRIIKSRAFQEGLKKGKIQMIPYVVTALEFGILGTVAVNKWNESRKLKMANQHISVDEALTAEELLIQKIQNAEENEEVKADEGIDNSEEGER